MQPHQMTDEEFIHELSLRDDPISRRVVALVDNFDTGFETAIGELDVETELRIDEEEDRNEAIRLIKKGRDIEEVLEDFDFDYLFDLLQKIR